MVVEMYYAVDTSCGMVHAFRTNSYRGEYLLNHYEGEAITPSEARAIMADFIGVPKTMYAMNQLCERYGYGHRCRFDGCMFGNN